MLDDEDDGMRMMTKMMLEGLGVGWGGGVGGGLGGGDINDMVDRKH